MCYANGFHSFVSTQGNNESIDSLPTHINTSELKSSLLSPYLESNTFEHEHAFAPTETTSLDPRSSEFYEQLMSALELDTPSYAHVPSSVMEKFKALWYKYPHAFYLPNSPLSQIKGFYHNIYTGDSPPVYRLPYRNSPAELTAINEVHMEVHMFCR